MIHTSEEKTQILNQEAKQVGDNPENIKTVVTDTLTHIKVDTYRGPAGISSRWARQYTFKQVNDGPLELTEIKKPGSNPAGTVIDDRVDNSDVTRTVREHLEERGYELK